MNPWKAILLKLVDELRESENFDWLRRELFTEEEWKLITDNIDFDWERDECDHVPSSYEKAALEEGDAHYVAWNAKVMEEALVDLRDHGLRFDTNPTLMGGNSMDIAGHFYNYVQRMDARAREIGENTLTKASYNARQELINSPRGSREPQWQRQV